MFHKLSNLIFITILLFLTVIGVSAQIDAPDGGSRNSQSSNKEDFPKTVKESLAKSRIDREKKDYDELLQNSVEASKISESLEKNFTQSSKLSADDQKNLDRLEKLARKIRRELGASDKDDEEEAVKPSSMLDAFKTLQTSTGSLADEVKKATRYSISVVAIQSSNVFLKVVRFIRFGKN